MVRIRSRQEIAKAMLQNDPDKERYVREDFLVAGGIQSQWEKFDGNGDNYVTKQEVLAMQEGDEALRKLLASDANADGEITLQEFLEAGGSEAVFKLYDLDENGTITRHEINVHLEELRKQNAFACNEKKTSKSEQDQRTSTSKL
eukprot:TRINITY_DN14380_c0_g1_i1.p1 TRINITY_DN14380_c0_g1~~TRINITY_DN14380_c0_g1_i1.p1  ORF type:complete len:145 (+),score=28.96 TRINITY_DN14380_c0_g1_i1:72-506(+)